MIVNLTEDYKDNLSADFLGRFSDDCSKVVEKFEELMKSTYSEYETDTMRSALKVSSDNHIVSIVNRYTKMRDLINSIINSYFDRVLGDH